MNQFGQPSNKRDFEMAMGFDVSSSYPMTGGMPPQGMPQQSVQNGPMGQQQAFFYPQQMGMTFNPHMAGALGMAQMQLPSGFDPQQMQYMSAPPRYYSSASAAPAVEATKEPTPKSNADWALEKRRARNRITAAESRRKCKEEIQNLRDELIRLKEEKQEKEELIEYYRNRYEKFEGGAEAPNKDKEVAESTKPAETTSDPVDSAEKSSSPVSENGKDNESESDGSSADGEQNEP